MLMSCFLQKGDLFKDVLIFANDKTSVEETIRKSSVIDWTRFLCLGFDQGYTEIFKSVASEKEAPGREQHVCRLMFLQDVSSLPDIPDSGMSLSSLDESHVSLVNQTWKFSNSDEALVMIRNMVTNFPSCCVLDDEGQPVSWILVYDYCAMGMLYTLPEHRGKGYAKVLICSMARRLHAEGYPVYCFIEEENTLSHRLFTKLGFTEAPSYRAAWFEFSEF
ncbi:glycine N-acyltransferase-like protein 3 [Labrus bergylta]|uniref:glycine N-acyltransferase-like protein 3 n=1 Tax=Labrus bergylta TaxID=56723 RepID=UPI0033144BCC